MEFKISKELEDYRNSINFMDSHINNMISNKKEDLIWLLEYPNIYTYGPLSKKKDLLEPKKFPVIPSERGGQYTYHGPGQRVVYLMINLKEKSRDIKKFIFLIENIIIESLSRIGLKAETSNEHHGIFIEKKNELYKIASIGMKFKKWISFHGFSLNIDPDLENYKGIRPCGLNNNLVTSIKNEGITIEKKIIDDILIDEIKNHFLK